MSLLKTKPLEWTYEMQNRALAAGWGVFDNSDHGMRIERHDEVGRFDCDAAAQAYVAAMAINGDEAAIAAWAHIAYHHAVLDAAESDTEYLR